MFHKPTTPEPSPEQNIAGWIGDLTLLITKKGSHTILHRILILYYPQKRKLLEEHP